MSKQVNQGTGKPARYFKEFKSATRRSWRRERRVVAKAEFTGGEANPRFVVTSLKRAECKPKYLYEKVYCPRGDMENRIKECQLDLYADRTSTATMRANQAALTCFVASTRARGADRAAPAAAAASTAVADSFFANSGSRIGAHAGAAAGDGAGRAERGTGTSPTRWPKPQHGKCFLPDLIVRCDVVGTVQVSLVDLAARDERIDFDGVVALDCDGVELVIIHGDVSVLRVFVAAALVRALDWLARDLVDQLLSQPVAGLLVDLAERYPLGR
jgi:hypothetical protein